MAYACKLCIAEKGLSGSDLGGLPRTEEELFAHMEAVHHCPVARDGETEEEAQERFLKEYPEALSCHECKLAGAPWATREEK